MYELANCTTSSDFNNQEPESFYKVKKN